MGVSSSHGSIFWLLLWLWGSYLSSFCSFISNLFSGCFLDLPLIWFPCWGSSFYLVSRCTFFPFNLAFLCASCICRFLSVVFLMVFPPSPCGIMIKQTFVRPSHFILHMFELLFGYFHLCLYAFSCIISSELNSRSQILFSTVSVLLFSPFTEL